MGFGQAIKSCFTKYAAFQGRAPRSEYWYFILFVVLVQIPASLVDEAIAPDARNGPVSGLLSLAVLLPQISVTVRRLHDTNRSGWLLGGFYVYIIATVIVAVAAFIGKARPDFGAPLGLTAIVLMIGVFVGAIWMFVLMVIGGTAGANKYGPDPLGPDVTVF